MPSPLGWVLAALVITSLFALRRRRRPPLRLADGGIVPAWDREDERDWGAFARAASAIADRAPPHEMGTAPPRDRRVSLPKVGVHAGTRPRRDRVGVMAEWDLQLVGPDGAPRDHRRFRNLIVNAGLDQAKDRLFNPATVAPVFGHVAIGTSAVPETPVDVTLGTEVARDAVAYTPGGTGVCTVDHTFPAGVGTGAITEVGLFDDAVAGNMFNRKTFAAINKTAADALKASCTVSQLRTRRSSRWRSSALYTGHDISGQPVERATLRDAVEWLSSLGSMEPQDRGMDAAGRGGRRARTGHDRSSLPA